MHLRLKLTGIFILMSLTANCSILPTTGGESTPTSTKIPVEATLTPTITVRNTGNTIEPLEPVETLPVTEDTNTNVALSIWHGLGEKETLAMYEIIGAFHREHPDIRIVMEYVPHDDLYVNYEKSTASDSGPGLLLGPGKWGPNLFETALIADMQSDISPQVLSNINPAALDAATIKDALIGLPYRLSGVVMYRNKSIIGDSPTTFDDLITFAEDASQGGFIGTYLDRGDIFGFAQLTACRGLFLDDEGSPGFNNDTGLCWLNLLQFFEDIGLVALNTDDDLDYFLAGRVGVIFDGTWNMRLLSESLNGDLVIDPWPVYENSHLSGFVWSENVFINPHLTDDEHDAAIQFAEFLLSSNSQTIMAESDFIPSVLNAEIPDPLLSQAVDSLEGGTAFPTNPVFNLFFVPLNTALKNVFENGVTPEKALDDAFNEIKSDIEIFRDDY